MIFQIRMMSGEKIPVGSIEEIQAIVAAANQGAKLIVTKHGVINAASIDSITKHKELMEDVQALHSADRKKAEQDILGDGVFKELSLMLQGKSEDLKRLS